MGGGSRGGRKDRDPLPESQASQNPNTSACFGSQQKIRVFHLGWPDRCGSRRGPLLESVDRGFAARTVGRWRTDRESVSRAVAVITMPAARSGSQRSYRVRSEEHTSE